MTVKETLEMLSNHINFVDVPFIRIWGGCGGYYVETIRDDTYTTTPRTKKYVIEKYGEKECFDWGIYPKKDTNGDEVLLISLTVK